MATNGTNEGVPSIPTIALISSIVHPALSTLLVAHSFLTLLIPLFLALFYYSTPQSRRRPIFILNVISICIAFGLGILIVAYGTHIILEPLNPWPLAFNIIIGFIGVWQSIIVDFTLFVRLVSVYPPILLGTFNFSLLIAIPVILKITRVINIILFTKVMVDAMNGPNAKVMMAVVFATAPYLKIEWAAQWIDNSYASMAFLWKMRHQTGQRILSGSSTATLVDCVRTLTRIALANFLLPTIFSIAQFICVYHNVNPITLNELVIANTYLATFGVVFATIWAGSISRDAQIVDSKRGNTTGRMMSMFGRRGTNGSSTVTDGSGHTLNEDVKA